MLAARRVPILQSLAPLLALVLCSTALGAASSVQRCEREAARQDRVLAADQLANWEPLDEQAVLIWTGDSLRAYLVRLQRPLPGLTRAPVITLVDADQDKTISACGRDALSLGDDGTAALIVSVQRLSRQRTEELEQAAQRRLHDTSAPTLKAL
jgi:hypothetical protein